MEKFIQFDNGLKLMVKRQEGLMSVACGVFVGVGSSKETTVTNGYSHFVEHMLFKGTKTRTSRQISEELDELGGNFNAFTGKEATCFYNRILPDNLDKALELLSDIFFNATFDSEELERERKVITEEILMDEDIPDDVCHDLLSRTFYGDSSLGYKVIGTAENVKNASREDLLAFKNKFYVPNNVCLSFAGNIDFEQAKQLAEKYFLNNFSVKNSNLLQLPRLSTCSGFQKKFKEVEQSHLAVAFNAIPYEDERLIPLRIATTAFGSGMSSRLFQTIRERHGLAYSVFAAASTYVNNGYLEIYLGTAPTNIRKAVDLLLEEVVKVKKGGITQRELERGKTQLKTGLAFAYESSLALMVSYGNCMLNTGASYDIESKIKQIDSVTAESASAVLRDCLNFDNCAAVYVGKECDQSDEISRFVNKRL